MLTLKVLKVGLGAWAWSSDALAVLKSPKSGVLIHEANVVQVHESWHAWEVHVEVEATSSSLSIWVLSDTHVSNVSTDVDSSTKDGWARSLDIDNTLGIMGLTSSEHFVYFII